MPSNKNYRKSLESKLTAEQLVRVGGFSKKSVKVLIDKSMVESMTMLDGDKKRRQEKKDGLADRDERGLFVTTRKDLCKSIKQPKKLAGSRQRKRENADTIQYQDGVSETRKNETLAWELSGKEKTFQQFKKINKYKELRRK